MPTPQLMSGRFPGKGKMMANLPGLVFFILMLMFASCVPAQAQDYQLKAPADWGGETIELPPGFAKDMKFKGVEHIRFAPGMMKPDSDSFFCYAFAFELQPEPKLTEATVKAEFLKYYRGLCKAVLDGKPPEKAFDTFRMELQAAKSDSDAALNSPVEYVGKLDWVEPFATKKFQQLNVEIRTWTKDGRNYLFASVSPQKREAEIWKQLRKIRDDYVKSQTAK